MMYNLCWLTTKCSRGGNPLNISRYEVVYPCHLRDFTLPFLHDLHATGRLFQPTHIETSSQKGLEAFSHILKPSVELPLCGSGDPLHFFSDHYLHVYVHIVGLNIKPKTPCTSGSCRRWCHSLATGSWMHREFGRGWLRFVEFQWLSLWNQVTLQRLCSLCQELHCCKIEQLDSKDCKRPPEPTCLSIVSTSRLGLKTKKEMHRRRVWIVGQYV